MNSYLKLSIAALMPAFVTYVFHFLNSRTSFNRIKESKKQVIYGIIFGGLAILGTEFGIPMGGAQANCRDGAVVVAGLLFGSQAGIIAGLIGGIERWFAVYWGVGLYTRVACTVSTILAGFYSALLRKYMFENKRPSWIISFLIGFVIEVFHLTMVFVTNMNDPLRAMEIVKACDIQMFVSNGMAVVLSSIVLTLVNKEKHNASEPTLSAEIQKWLLGTVVFVFALTTYFVIRIQNGIVIVQAESSANIAYQIRDISVYINTFLEIIVFALLFGIIYLLLKKTIVRKIHGINSELSEIISGNLDQQIDERSCVEFSELADGINDTVNALKTYIKEAETRIDKELEFAKAVQTSSLPKLFKHEFEYDIYASMDTAKEVGGDFYDFYRIGKTLNFLIADVSGKGIAAAMFMMRAKTELKTLTESKLDVNEVFTLGNRALCEGNDAGLFVTAWQGSINLDTGVLTFSNAGHNPPLICHEGGTFEFVKAKCNLVLAGLDTTQYKLQTIQLEKGDIVYLYTDGVTEANDKDENLYGDERLRKVLNSKKFSSMKELCRCVKEDVDLFAGNTEQFDDITMLAVRYNGKPDVKEMHFDKMTVNDIDKATEFVNDRLEESSCPKNIAAQMDIALDEVLSNIINHGYEGTPGEVGIRVATSSSAVEIQFSDSASAYNPLTAKDPDSSLSAEERKIGGLGIFIVKKIMSEVHYEYKDSKNILTVKKNYQDISEI